MKKLSILAAVFAAIVFSACGNKTAQNADGSTYTTTFEMTRVNP